jgi:PAS domain S-box-containing protein
MIMTTSTPSRSLKWPIIVNYAIAVVSAATSAVVTFALHALWGAEPALSLLLCVVTLVALAAGPGPAALAFALTFLSFLLSRGYLFVLPSGETLGLGLFVVASALVVLLSATQKKTSTSLQLLRNSQQMMIRELQKQNDGLRVENAERSEVATRAQIAEQEIRQTVDTVPALIARYRADGFMDFRNKNWREYTGLSQDNLGGRRWGSALHPDDEEMARTYRDRRAVRTGTKAAKRRWRVQTAPGSPRTATW